MSAILKSNQALSLVDELNRKQTNKHWDKQTNKNIDRLTERKTKKHLYFWLYGENIAVWEKQMFFYGEEEKRQYFWGGKEILDFETFRNHSSLD